MLRVYATSTKENKESKMKLSKFMALFKLRLSSKKWDPAERYATYIKLKYKCIRKYGNYLYIELIYTNPEPNTFSFKLGRAIGFSEIKQIEEEAVVNTMVDQMYNEMKEAIEGI